MQLRSSSSDSIDARGPTGLTVVGYDSDDQVGLRIAFTKRELCSRQTPRTTEVREKRARGLHSMQPEKCYGYSMYRLRS